MPKVGPCEGCRMAVITFFPRCTPSAWERPTVVVVLPSPRGSGSDGRHINIHAILAILQAVKNFKFDLGLIGTIQFQFIRANTKFLSHLQDGLEFGFLGDIDIRGHRSANLSLVGTKPEMAFFTGTLFCSYFDFRSWSESFSLVEVSCDFRFLLWLPYMLLYSVFILFIVMDLEPGYMNYLKFVINYNRRSSVFLAILSLFIACY